MADEFIKGLGFLTVGGLAWMVFAGWYQTPTFETTRQLISEPPEPNNFYDVLGILGAELFLWVTILGTLTFWVGIPAARELRRALEDRQSAN